MLGDVYGVSEFAVAIYAVSIMISISGISLGLGFALNERKLKEFGREELYQSLLNGVILGSLISLFSQGGIVGAVLTSPSTIGGTSFTCPSFALGNPSICAAFDYLSGSQTYTFMGVQHQSILSMSTSAISALFGLNAVLGMISSIRINALVVSFSFSYAFAPVISEIQFIIKALGEIAIGAMVQSAILVFASVSALSTVIPIGMVMRSFYVTRKVGGFLIALGVGIYAVLPMSYVLNMFIANSYSSVAFPAEIGQTMYSAVSTEGTLLSIGQNPNQTAGSGFGGEISGLISGVSNSFAQLINQALAYVSYLIAYAFVLPAFSLVLTVISIRELSMILGGEAPLQMLRLG